MRLQGKGCEGEEEGERGGERERGRGGEEEVREGEMGKGKGEREEGGEGQNERVHLDQLTAWNESYVAVALFHVLQRTLTQACQVLGTLKAPLLQQRSCEVPH